MAKVDIFHWNIQRCLRKSFNEERGMALSMTVISLVVILMVFALVTEFGYVLIVKHQVQGVADAGAIAGAMMATAIRDGENNIAIAIDPATAEPEAREAMELYLAEIKVTQDDAERVYSEGLVVTFTDNNQTINTEVEYTVRTVLLKTLMRMVGAAHTGEFKMSARASASPN